MTLKNLLKKPTFSPILMDKAGSRVGDPEVGDRGSVQAADEGGFSLFPAKTDIGGSLEDFSFGVFEDNLQFPTGGEVAHGVPGREGDPQVAGLIKGDAVGEPEGGEGAGAIHLPVR